jgi:RraA family protein
MYQGIETSTIGHFTDFGFLKGMKPISRPVHFVGNAVTVRIPHLDSTAVHKSFDYVEEGDVLIIDMSGDVHRSCFGGMLAYAAHVKKVAGVIVAGSVNDVDEIKEIGLPVFSLGISPMTTRVLGIEGEINTTISICGVSIHPGDIVVADNDGVVVINSQQAEKYIDLAMKKQNKERENELRKRLDSGVSLATFMANKLLENKL